MCGKLSQHLQKFINTEDSQWLMSQQCALAAEADNSTLGCA